MPNIQHWKIDVRPVGDSWRAECAWFPGTGPFDDAHTGRLCKFTNWATEAEAWDWLAGHAGSHRYAATGR